MEGFICRDRLAQWPAYFRQLGEYLAQGKLVYEVDIMDDLKMAVRALRTLYAPGHRAPGKLVVRVSDDETGDAMKKPTEHWGAEALESGH